RHGGERAAHAVPGRHPRRPGRPPGGQRDDRARGRLRGGAGGRVLVLAGRHPGELGGGPALGAGHGGRRARPAVPRLGQGRHADLRLGAAMRSRAAPAALVIVALSLAACTSTTSGTAPTGPTSTPPSSPST